MNSTTKKISVFLLALVAAGALYFVFRTPPATDMADNDAPAAASQSVYLSGLKDLQGKAIDMSSDKLLFVNVWATWCGPCNMEMPGIQRLYDRYKDNKKMAFYIVSDEDAETVNPFIARKGYDLPFYQITEGYPDALNGNAIPRTYIIWNGQILAQETGAAQWDRPEVIELIDKKLSEI